jgi:tRNA (guanosine-2'-O-)-methyltransferase
MRRSTPGCSFIAEEQRKLLAALRSADAVAVARTLEAFVRPERGARLRAVFAARLDAVTVLMDAPHDPHNGAAVLRSCDAFGLQRIHVLERIERFLAANTVSCGSERWVDVRTYAAPEEAVAALRASGHELVATHPEGELLPPDLAAIPRLALVLGNERRGILAEVAQACARSVRVPMRGFAESLNVSVTAAILIEQAARGRPGDLPEDERAFLYARALVLTVPHAPEILAARGVRVPLEGVA